MFASQTQPVARRSGTLLGQVLGLLAFSLLFTAGGAIVAPVLGAAAPILGILGSLMTLLALVYARWMPAPVRLGLFYCFSTFEGMILSVILSAYFAAGLGNSVVLAAGTTCGLVLALSAYAWTTQRDLAGLGSYLFVGLIGVLLASLLGIFVSAPVFHLVIAGITAILFSGYVLYDVQRLKRADTDADPNHAGDRHLPRHPQSLSGTPAYPGLRHERRRLSIAVLPDCC